MNPLQKKILFIVCGAILLGYVIVACFIFPFGDDFSYALKGQEGELMQTILNERNVWSGRYTSNFLLIHHPLNWGGLIGYRIMAIMLICLSLTGFFAGLKILKIKSAGLLSVVFLSVVISSLPNVTEAFYWVCGAWTYMPAAVLLFVQVAVLGKKNGAIKGTQFIGLATIILFASGLTELYSFLSLLIMLLFFYLNYFETRKLNYFLILLIVIQSVLIYFVWTAPGNEIRTSLFKNNHNLTNSIYLTVLYTTRFIGEWLLNPLVYLIGYWLLKTNEVKLKFPTLKRPLIIMGILFIPTILACFAPIWTTGILGQHRTANFACYLFIGSLFLIIIANKEKLNGLVKFKSKMIFPLTVLVLIFWKNNYFLIEESVSGELPTYFSDLENRIKLLKNCDTKTCPVPMLLDKPNTFQVYTLDFDSKHWRNEGYQFYYKSGKVIPVPRR